MPPTENHSGRSTPIWLNTLIGLLSICGCEQRDMKAFSTWEFWPKHVLWILSDYGQQSKGGDVNLGVIERVISTSEIVSLKKEVSLFIVTLFPFSNRRLPKVQVDVSAFVFGYELGDWRIRDVIDRDVLNSGTVQQREQQQLQQQQQQQQQQQSFEHQLNSRTQECVQKRPSK